MRQRGHAQVSGTFATRAEAEFWRVATLRARERGEAPPSPPQAAPALPPRPVTVAEACVEFVQGAASGAIRTRSGHPYKASTIRGHENRLRLYVLPRIGAIPLRALRRADVRRLVEEVGAEASPQTAANVRDALRRVLARQVYLEELDANPAAGVAAPSAPRAAARFLTPAEADRLQQVADDHPNVAIGALVALALGTGLRRGELEALTWGAGGLDFDAQAVRVRGTLDRAVGIVAPKSRRPREVPLGADLVARLRLYRLASGQREGEPVFCGSPRRAWERVRAAADLGELRVHDLRHTCATFWLAAGLTVHAVAELLGHTDAALVLRLYGHALPREVATAAERLEAWRAAQRG